MVGVSSQAVGKWEKGSAPDAELLPVLAGQLGVTIDALLGMESGEQINVEDAVGRRLDSLLDALEERQIVCCTELKLSERKVKAYRLSNPAPFVAFLYMARYLMQTGMNYLHMWKNEPVLQGEK